MVHKAKDEAVRDMVDSLLAKHPAYNKDDIITQEIQSPDGPLAIRVTIRKGFNDIDWQTATLTPVVTTSIVREPDYPEGHPYKKDEGW